MAPKFIAPRVWRRPYSAIYNDNYRFGSSLYSTAIDDIERKYHESMARTTFRSDRSDLGLESFAGHAGSSPPVDHSAWSRTVQESDYRHELQRSLSAGRINYSATTSDPSRQMAQAEAYSAYASAKALASVEAEIDESKARRRRRRHQVSDHTMDSGVQSTSSVASVHHSHPVPTATATLDNHTQVFWMERCRELQTEIDRLNGQLIDTETRIKQESAAVKNKLNAEVADLIMAFDDQERVIQDMQKSLKRQQQSIRDLNGSYEASHRGYAEAMDQLAAVQRKASQLCHEVDDIRANVDKACFKSASTSYFTF